MLRLHSTFPSMISAARCFACWKPRRPSGICTSSLKSPIWKWTRMGLVTVYSGPMDSWEKEPERKEKRSSQTKLGSFRCSQVQTYLDPSCCFFNYLVIANLFYSASLMVKCIIIRKPKIFGWKMPQRRGSFKLKAANETSIDLPMLTLRLNLNIVVLQKRNLPET